MLRRDVVFGQHTPESSIWPRPSRETIRSTSMSGSSGRRTRVGRCRPRQSGSEHTGNRSAGKLQGRGAGPRRLLVDGESRGGKFLRLIRRQWFAQCLLHVRSAGLMASAMDLAMLSLSRRYALCASIRASCAAGHLADKRLGRSSRGGRSRCGMFGATAKPLPC